MFKNKMVSLLLSVLVAFGLWAYVITFVSSDMEGTFYDIPVSLQGEALLAERGLMITTQEKPTVTLTLYGNRRELNKLNDENITIVADVSKIGEPGTHSLNYTPYYPGDIPSNAFTVQSQYPGMVKLTVEKRVTKPVPVVLDYVGTVQKDYIADKETVELDNETVTITGPASVVDRITQAVVEVDLEGKSASFIEAYRFTLCDAEKNPVDSKMVEASVAEVSVTQYIKRVKEIALVYTVVEGGGATERTSEITVDPEVIKVAGNETLLEDLEELNLGVIDLGELTKDSELTFTINLPNGVENLSGKTEAKVTVKFPELMTKTFTVTTFNAKNVPEGLEVEFITEELTVTVRGPKKLVGNMTANDLIVTVDFSNAAEGNYTMKADVTMVSAYERVGAMGTYKISATLTAPEEEDAKK